MLRFADGWIPGHAADWHSPRFAQSRPLIEEAAAAAGRDPAEIGTIYNFPGRITTAPLSTARDEHGRWIGGSVEQWTDELVAAVLDHGAAGFVYLPVNDGTPTDIALGRWGREIVPAVREALGQRSGTGELTRGA